MAWRWAPMQFLAIVGLRVVVIAIFAVVLVSWLIKPAALVLMVVCSIALRLASLWGPMDSLWHIARFWKMPLIDGGLLMPIINRWFSVIGSFSWLIDGKLSVRRHLSRFRVLFRILFSFMPLSMRVFVVFFVIVRCSVVMTSIWSRMTGFAWQRGFSILMLVLWVIILVSSFTFNIALFCRYHVPIWSLFCWYMMPIGSI